MYYIKAKNNSGYWFYLTREFEWNPDIVEAAVSGYDEARSKMKMLMTLAPWWLDGIEICHTNFVMSQK